MIRSLAAILFALVMMGGLAVSAQADSVAVSGNVTGTTTLTDTSNPAVFDASFTGSGVDAMSGPFTATNTSMFTFTSLTTFTESGTWTDVFAGGTVFGTFSGMGSTATGGVITLFNLITGGTGAFAGETGETTVTGTTTSTGVFSGTYTGFVTTPEPSSLALMLAGIGLLPLMRKRLARGGQAT